MSLVLQNLTLAYGPRILLRNVSANLPQGSLTALIGRNGTGKSTLLRCCAGLGAAVSGDVLLCGEPLGSLSPRRLAATVSLVTTDKVRIADMTCAQLVAMGRAPYTDWIGRLSSDDRQAVRRALELVDMEAFAGKTMETLSDGECQRVMIARALAQDTPVILLDEPTAFLDLPNRYALASLVARLARKERKCILFSTHDLDIALSMCDAVMLLDTPDLHLLPAAEMAASSLLERLFSDSGVIFDPVSRGIRKRNP